MVNYILIIIMAIFVAIADYIDFGKNKYQFKNEVINTWIYGNKVYMKDWMYPFFMFLSDGWHFSKGVVAFSAILLVASSIYKFIILAMAWMLIHEIILHGGDNA